MKEEDSLNKTSDREPPISQNLIQALSAIGIVSIILGVIAGLVSISNAPEYAYTDEKKALKTAAYIASAIYITSGILSGLVFITLSSLCQAVREIWKAQIKNQ